MPVLTEAPVTHQIGEMSVTRLSEITLDVATPATLYPGWRPELLDSATGPVFTNSWNADRTHLLLSVHTWVVRTPRHTILIDTGAGNDKERSFQPIFDHLQQPYLERLEALALTPAQVDFVFLTHLHTDHVGWNTQLVNGRWVPTFPNARYFMPKLEHEYFSSPANQDHPRRGLYADSVLPIIESGQAEFVSRHATSVLEGFRFLSTPGHSLDHMSIAMQSKGEEAIFGGDVLHHPLQVLFPHLNSIYCELPDQARESRRWVLNYAAESRAVYFSTHFPETSLGQISRHGDTFAWRYLAGKE